MMIPKDTTVACPSCDTDFDLEKDMYEGDTIYCENCDAKLVMEDGDLETEDNDIYRDDEDDEEEDNPQRPIGAKN